VVGFADRAFDSTMSRDALAVHALFERAVGRA